MLKPCALQTPQKTELRPVTVRAQGAEVAPAREVEVAADMTAPTAETAAADTDPTAPEDAEATAETAIEMAAGTSFASITSVAIAVMATDASSPMTPEADDIKLNPKMCQRSYFNMNKFLRKCNHALVSIITSMLLLKRETFKIRQEVDIVFFSSQKKTIGDFNITATLLLRAFPQHFRTTNRSSFCAKMNS